MENRYNKNDRVYVGSVGKYKVIEDIEVFGDLILYYMDDMTAYPEKDLFERQLHFLCHQITNNPMSEEEQINVLNNI